MSGKIQRDLAEMKKKLNEYIDKGRAVGYPGVRKEPAIMVKPQKSKIKPLKKMDSYKGNFTAVDCSTRTLKRANNWGIYLLRAAYAVVRGRDVDWGYGEKMCTVIADAYRRRWFLRNARLELESETALSLLHGAHEEDYLLLDGASYFGGPRRFQVSLYEACRKKRIKLLAISKQSPMLHDEKGRDFIAAACMLSSYGLWVYHPVVKANTDKHLYGDISLMKLCQSSPRVFRCDIMEYLADYGAHELLSPLTSISEDPRCLGYPVTLWLAHDFSTPSDSMLLHYHDQVEGTLANAGLLDVLRTEELSCNFVDELHGAKHPFRWELIEHV